MPQTPMIPPSAAPNTKRAGDAPQHGPNLLFVFSDQQSYDALGCYGNPTVQTPRIDALARQGVRFNHCVANAPVCTAYRGILFSGLHPLHNGAVFNDLQMLPAERGYFAHALTAAGYRTGYIGKWHLHGGDRDRPVPAGPLRYGFDDLLLTNNCTLEYRAGCAWYWDEQGRRRRYDQWEPDSQTDQAIGFLEDIAARNTDQPFALFVSWHPPHNWTDPDRRVRGPWFYGAPPEAMQRYDGRPIHLRPTSPATEAQRAIYRGYYALCTNLDDNMGRLLDTLERLGLDDNTVVVYTSDHGDCLRSIGRYDQNKCRPEAESCRVPLIVRAPGLDPGVSDLLIGTFDLMPTCLGLLGIEPPAACHGQNLRDAVRSGRDDVIQTQPLFLSAFDDVDWRGVYTHRYTYSFGPDGRRFNRLYDRRADPGEMNNLYDDPGHRALRDELHASSVAWMRRFGDRFVRHEQLVLACAAEPTPDGTRMYKSPSGAVRGRPVDLCRQLPGLLD